VIAAYDLDVSPAASNNIYFVAIAGSVAGPLAAVYYYNLGASVGAWHNAVTDFGNASFPPVGANPTAMNSATSFRSVKFAPDGTLMALAEITANLQLHLVSLTAHNWDTGYLPGSFYPVGIEAFGAHTWRASAIAVGPDFSGSDQETQQTFIGASVTVSGTESGGIYRVDESGDVKEIKANTGIFSIDYDGTTVVAGAYMDNNVFRVTDPLSSSPSAASARSLKRIGIDTVSGTPDTFADMVIVHFAGENLFGGKSGSASALSKSTDSGNTWNDFTLMDSSNTDIDDLMIAPDASVKFQSSNDWNGTSGEVSIYRVSAAGTQRVLCVDQIPSTGHLNLLLRGISSDMDIVYAFDEGGTAIYQSSDGGVTRWSLKTTFPGTGAIGDLAVESASVIYAAGGQLIYKSTSSGSSWSSGVDTGVAIFSILSLGENQLVIGGQNTYVGWSTDGGATWTKNGPPIAGANFLVQATGLTATDYIFVAPFGGTAVYRANPTPFVEFKSMNLPAYATNVTTMDMLLTNGILYVIGSTPGVGTVRTDLYHTLAPSIPGSHTAALWGTLNDYTGGRMIAPVIQAAVTGTEIDLYSALAAPFNGVFYFTDIVSLPAPVLTGPADGSLFKIVSSMLADSQLVNFTWTRASPTITSYWLWLALDSGFTQIVTIESVPSNISPIDVVSFIGERGMFEPGLTYYWRINAETPFNGGFSETRSFTISPSEATVPDILSPANGTTITTTSPAFTWSASTSATLYDFQISELPGFETTVFTDQTTSPAEALPVTISLEVGKTYYWRVRAAQPVQGDWSNVGTFTIAAPPTSTSAPPPVTITQTSITIPIPTPTTTIITQPAPVTKEIAPAYIWAIIVIGAILVIAVIVLIVRTRRSV